MRLGLFAAFGLVLGLVAPGAAFAGPGLVAGVVEDGARAPTLVGAESNLENLRLAGYRAVRITSYWRPGLTEPSPSEAATLKSVADAGTMTGVAVYVTIMSPGSATTPLTDEARAQFASYAAGVVRDAPSLRHVIIGNEPNLNRFWLPQFNPDGSSAAPRAYLTLLAQTYDAVKAVSPTIEVIGGAVSPRGTDQPGGIRPTHSPTTFIQHLGEAYRASGRDRPVMDAFMINVYGDNSSSPPTVGHPKTTAIGIADYDKLVGLLGQAFDGTPQRGSDLPIFYGEYGVETQIPPSKAALYTGTEPTTTKPVPEATQAAYYEQALAMAFCQPTVEGILLFLSRDQQARAAWQSGLFYVDGTPKSSRPLVTQALDRTAGGSITRCPGVQLVVKTTYLRFGTRSAAKRGVLRTSFTCDLDCNYRLRLENADTHATKLSARGTAPVGKLTQIDLGPRRLKPGRYRYTLSLVHPVNPGPPTLRRSAPFSLP
jgi:hypothetical protein